MKRVHTPRPKAGGIHLWLVLWKAYAALQAHAYQDIRSSGLGLSDFAVLEMLLHKGPAPVNAIGAQVDLTSGSISVAIDRLAHKGLVKRRDDPDDRRARMVHLTPRGRKLIERAFERHAAAMERATSGLSQTERAQAVRLLKKLGMHAAELRDQSSRSSS
ncbi:MAG TPA: MarR family winged helix-turn-helix transcriptional regulator [Bryobacteraceae bacterium]|nr:MarR family winged helix-turn-helix transcriptional regulator [Bryobacteraceae bacterium]